MADENVNENLETTTPVETTGNANDGKLFDHEDLAKARTDEKNKLYPQIEKLKAEVLKLSDKLSSNLLSISEKDEAIKEKDAKIAELEALIQKLEEKGAENKVSDKLVKELQAKLDEALQLLGDKEAEVAQIKLSSYKAEKIKDLDESVVDLVTGNTEADIDASVEKAKAIFEKVSAKFADKKVDPAQTNKSTLPKVNLSTINESTFKDVKPEDIMTLDVKSPEGRKQWAEMKARMGMR